ncbi:MAG: UDP-3-O-(3-hydroxymyristoyl)glucosamine N-acyltransferase [Candidatus Saganbacteria bacterium]|nr:UDP-3-O-(3-hydroxymyristoyl)glucosamine N-acyltransferase [Candidatus Saganbacteria bacterium]
MKLKEIAKLVSGSPSGDSSVEIGGVASLEDAKEGELSFVLEEKFTSKAETSKASAFIAGKKSKLKHPTIIVDNPRAAMAKILPLFSKRPQLRAGIHPSAVVEKSAKIGLNVYIGPFVFIGENSEIGDGSIVHSNVSVYDNVIIGKNVILHSGVVLGVDGFGFIPTKGAAIKIPQIGKLFIEDDVEIYANTCIARGALGETRIGKGTKIDNLTHIAHNCKSGDHCLIAGQVGFAGSAKLGSHVLVAGQAGFKDYVQVGDNSIVLGKAGVTKDIPKNSTVSGFPAQDHKTALRQQAKLRKLLEEK